MRFRKPLVVLTAMAMSLVLSRGVHAAPTDDEKLQARFDALMKEYREGMQAYQEKLSEYFKLNKSKKAEDKKKAQEVLQEALKSNPSSKMAPKFAEIAKAAPKSDIGRKAITFVLQNNRTGGKVSQEMVDLVVEHHFASKEVTKMMGSLVFANGFNPNPLFEKVLAENPNKDCQAMACYSWARRLMRKTRGGAKTDPKALELMTRVVKEFGDVKYRGKKTYAQVAEGALFEINRLQIGMTVPDIQGEDVDGKSFSLNEYRGKVVVIDFWGDW